MHTKQPVEVDTSKGYEQSDLPMRGIRMGMIGLVAIGMFGSLATFPIMRALKAQVGRPEKVEHYDLRQMPPHPAPILQDSSTNQVDTYNLRRRENERMTTEGVDTQTGRRYIPIKEALEQEAAQAGQ
jgi:hypothetical protein